MKIKKTYIILLVFITILFLFILYNKYIIKIIYPKKYGEYIEKYVAEYNIDPLLIYSIIKAESNFNENAISNMGAKGLMQIMDSTANEIKNNIDNLEINNDNDIMNPENNIRLGLYYYSYLFSIYNNMEIALAAYNAGPGNVDKWISDGTIKADGSDVENIPFKETNMYVRKIISNYKEYKKIYK